MGHIYKRKYKDKDGNIREGKIYWIKYYRNGKDYRESSKSTKRTDAKKLLKKREGEISQGKLPGIYFDRTTFEDLVELIRIDYKVNEYKTFNRIELAVEHLSALFSGKKAQMITTPLISRYIDMRLAEGASNGSINRELSALRRMFRLGVQHNKVDRPPHIDLLKEHNVRKGFFEHGDFLALREALPEYLGGFITFGYRVGWRISEIANLTWAQVDRANGIVRLEPGKTKNDEGRTVYLDDELKEVFEQQWERRLELGTALPYVFLNHNGTDKVKRFDKAWRTACKAIGLPHMLFHDFRRTAVRNMVRAGIPERVAMAVSGHKTRSIFERYNIVSDADLRLAAQKQAAYLENQTGTISGTILDLNTKKGLGT